MTADKYSKRFIIYVASIAFLSMCILSGCSREAGEDVCSYNEAHLLSHLEDSIEDGKDTFTVSYLNDDYLEENISSFIDGCFDKSYLSSCLVREISAEYDKHGSYTDISFSIEYKNGFDLNKEIQNVYDRNSLENAMIKSFSSNQEKTAFILNSFTCTEDEFRSAINEAEINCAEIPCEADEVSYAVFNPAGDRQLVIAGIQIPADEKTLYEKKQQLEKSVSSALLSIKEKKINSVSDTYENIFEYIINCSEYDYNLASSTLTGHQALTDEMHINRSAYGALVTGKTVCTGYARAYKLLCDELSMPCKVVTGTKNGVSHAWNSVSIDSDTFYVDCTAGATGAPISEAFLFTEDQAEDLGYVSGSFQ